MGIGVESSCRSNGRGTSGRRGGAGGWADGRRRGGSRRPLLFQDCCLGPSPSRSLILPLHGTVHRWDSLVTYDRDQGVIPVEATHKTCNCFRLFK